MQIGLKSKISTIFHDGFCFKLIGAIISCSSKKQAIVILSTTEAEYVALVEAYQETQWLKILINDV